MLCDVVRRRRRRRWAHAPVIHAASHFDHKKRVAWVPISMHTCGSFFYNYGAPLGGPSGRRSSANNNNNNNNNSGAPAAEGRQAEPHTHIRELKGTHELIFSCSWARTHDDDGGGGGVAQQGSHTPILD